MGIAIWVQKTVLCGPAAKTACHFGRNTRCSQYLISSRSFIVVATAAVVVRGISKLLCSWYVTHDLRYMFVSLLWILTPNVSSRYILSTYITVTLHSIYWLENRLHIRVKVTSRTYTCRQIGVQLISIDVTLTCIATSVVVTFLGTWVR